MTSFGRSGRARRLRVLLLAGCSSLAMVALASLPARAQTAISAGATWTLDPTGSPTPGSDSQATPAFPSPNIFPSASDTNNNSIFGHVYGDSTNGNFFGSRSSGAGNFTITGTLDYQTNFVNVTGGVVNPTLAFLIDAGELNVILPTGATAANASLTAVITESINGGPASPLFNYASSMSVTDPTQNPTFSESGATFNPAGPTLSAGDGDYSWSAYSGSVSLGALNPGDSVLLDYTLVSNASGSGTCSGGGPVYGTVAIGSTAGVGSGSSCDTALARIGDPDTITADSPFDLPEPASAVVLSAGLASLAFMRRRRQQG